MAPKANIGVVHRLNTKTRRTRYPEGESLRVLQITDTHLYATPEGRLLGLNTWDVFEQTLEHARRTVFPVDLILATGDLVHDATEAGYRAIRSRLDALGVPVYCLPGNHDVPETMARCMNGGRVQYRSYAQHGDWSLIFLDSTIEDNEGGHLSDHQLAALADGLSAHPETHTLVCLHHHPVPVGSAWMDTMALNNPEPFFNLVDRHPQIKGVLWGHVHQEYDGHRNGVRLLGSPSTCVQFTPRHDDFAVDVIPPGYRWLELLPNGAIRTGVERLAGLPAEIDLRSAGY